MQVIQNTATPVKRFPVLLEVLEREEAAADEYGVPPTDILESTYIQGPTPDLDRLGDTREVANDLEIFECHPGYTGAGEPAYLREGKLFVRQAGQERPLLEEGGIWLARFSPDGRHLAYVQDGSPNPALWLAGADGTQAQQVATTISNWRFNDVNFGPDGELWFARAHGGLWRLDPTSQTPEQVVTEQPVDEFTLSNDGKTLAYLDDMNGCLRSRDLATGKEQLLGWSEEGSLMSPTFSPDGSRVLYTARQADFDQDETSRTTCQLYAVASDGRGEPWMIEDNLDIQRIARPWSLPGPILLAR